MYLSCVLVGLNQTKVQLNKVYSIDTHEVHLNSILIHFKYLMSVYLHL